MAHLDLCLSQSNKEIVLIGADLYLQFHTGCVERINKILFCVETLYDWTLTGINNEIWEKGFDWDEELGRNLRTKWEKWCKEVHSLVDLSIPSYYFKADESNEESNEYQIVIFCDASERAYGAIAYIHYKANSDFHVKFVSSKARIAPLKKLSLP
ncbi:uncharacterized protein TNCV_1680521 [Trichonephila clavipes]|nr:uncharacterized protein TNCV_1680521 [Trichonephila clavipes]